MPMPTELKKTSPTETTIWWNDGHVSIFPMKYLRTECACAGCINEFTGERMLDPDTVSEKITITGAQHVGNYGVQFFFDDGHSNGIFTWVRLRELCPCSECEKR
jgi:DUF971 family protein